MFKTLLLIFLVGNLSSCSLFGGDDNDNTGENLKIQFKLDDVASSQRFPFRDASTMVPNEVIYVALNDVDMVIEHQALLAGENSIQVPKGFIYLFSFVYNPSLTGTATGGIQLIGNLNLAELGLDSLPISGSAEENMDLGTLQLADGRYRSDVTKEYAAEVLGYSETVLLNYGAYDETANRLLNPDIDQNGIYDSDEDLFWEFRSSNSFHWYTYNYDDLVNSNSDAVIKQLQGTYRHSFHIILRGNLGHGGNNETYLEYETPSGWIQVGKVDDMTDTVGSRVEADGSQWYVFENSITALLDGQPGPWDGNYRINHPSKQYFFYNMQFNQPYKSESLFIYPFFTLTGNDPEYYDKISWTWKKVQGTSISDLVLEELQLLARDLPNFGVRKVEDDSTFNDRYSAQELKVEDTIPLETPILRSDYASRVIQVDLTYCDNSSTYYQGYNDKPF